MRAFLRLLGRLLAVLLAIALLAAAVVAVRGYGMYRSALEEGPVERVVDEVRRSDGYVSADELPECYLRAVVAIEDHRFYDHPGIDLISVCRATWHDLTTLSLEQGGSTITQQLAKNLFFSQDKDFARKIAETLMAFELEGRYSKAEILELYVNTSYFGRGLTGIGPAARGLLGKEPGEMSVCECALMAGLPNDPEALSADPARARERRDLVLAQMEKYGLARGDVECP